MLCFIKRIMCELVTRGAVSCDMLGLLTGGATDTVIPSLCLGLLTGGAADTVILSL